MAYLYNQGLIVVGNRDKSIITPATTPPVEGSWRRRVEGIGEASYLVYEKYVSGVWILKSTIS
jgi:hypothetical protein